MNLVNIAFTNTTLYSTRAITKFSFSSTFSVLLWIYLYVEPMELCLRNSTKPCPIHVHYKRSYIDDMPDEFRLLRFSKLQLSIQNTVPTLRTLDAGLE